MYIKLAKHCQSSVTHPLVNTRGFRCLPRVAYRPCVIDVTGLRSLCEVALACSR